MSINKKIKRAGVKKTPSKTVYSSKDKEAPYGFGELEIDKPKNFYSTIPKKYITQERTYKNFQHIQIKIPFRGLIIGASGSGKTNTVINLFDQINAFERTYLFAKDIEQPLYKYLRDTLEEVGLKLKPPQVLITASTDIATIPPVEDFDKSINNLVIFDDIVLEDKKLQKKIAQYYIRGRNQNISVVYLSQSYFEVPKIIRNNADYIFIKKITTSADLGRIIKEYSLAIDPKILEEVYQRIRKLGLENFLLIDTNANDDKLKYRLNFQPLPSSLLKGLKNSKDDSSSE